MIPQSKPKPKKNSSKVNLTISFVFHAVLVLALIYFAARSGYLGKKLQKISVTMTHEKPPVKPPAPPPPPPKIETPKVVDVPKMAPPKAEAPPPPAGPPVTAPPPAELPSFDFSDGAKAVNSESDPVQLYKGYIEYVLREKWNRPDNLPDDKYVAEVQIHVDRLGNLSGPVWQKGSGDKTWDDSVREVFKNLTAMDRRPPTNFPPMVTIRFDVQQETEPVLQ